MREPPSRRSPRSGRSNSGCRCAHRYCSTRSWTGPIGSSSTPSFTENADSPTATPANCRAVQRIALPTWFDARAISPLAVENLAGLAPALIQAVGTDPLKDQAPAYAERLRQAGVEVTLTHYPEAVHSFLSMPGLVPAARPARAEILGHLRSHLLERSGAPTR
ncbi:alpha/beta hydrolase [Nocardia asiatica]|uniref:alpha/beta hydrolase n=1 Tax=Nocardia asiatica TaxID=209252 RepID=UPI003EE2F9C6